MHEERACKSHKWVTFVLKQYELRNEWTSSKDICFSWQYSHCSLYLWVFVPRCDIYAVGPAAICSIYFDGSFALRAINLTTEIFHWNAAMLLHCLYLVLYFSLFFLFFFYGFFFVCPNLETGDKLSFSENT